MRVCTSILLKGSIPGRNSMSARSAEISSELVKSADLHVAGSRGQANRAHQVVAREIVERHAHLSGDLCAKNSVCGPTKWMVLLRL